MALVGSTFPTFSPSPPLGPHTWIRQLGRWLWLSPERDHPTLGHLLGNNQDEKGWGVDLWRFCPNHSWANDFLVSLNGRPSECTLCLVVWPKGDSDGILVSFYLSALSLNIPGPSGWKVWVQVEGECGKDRYWERTHSFCGGGGKAATQHLGREHLAYQDLLHNGQHPVQPATLVRMHLRMHCWIS